MSDRDNYVSTERKSVNSTLLSRNILIGQKRTSIRLEPDMWVALFDIARREGCTINDVCTLVDFAKKSETSLTAAIRVFLMSYYKDAATEEGHRNAGHGTGALLKSLVTGSRKGESDGDDFFSVREGLRRNSRVA